MKSKFFIVAITALMLFLYYSLLDNHSRYFDDINHKLSKVETLCLNDDLHEDDIEKVLIQNHYVECESDAKFIADVIVERLENKKNINSLFDLNKNSWKATVDEVEKSSGEMHKDLYKRMCMDLEQTEIPSYEKSDLPSKIILNDKFDGEISVYVYRKDENASWISKTLRKDKVPCSNIYVRLKEHYYNDSLKVLLDESKAVLKTDVNGLVTFKGLDKDASYSVLPISKGHKYGSAKGTIQATLADYEDAFFEFEQLPITIPLFLSKTIRQIKDDGTFIVRTPEDFKKSLSFNFVLILIIWWGAIILLKLCRRSIDYYMAGSLMGLTGICLLMMYSLNNPLTDVMLGEEMAIGIMVGCVLLFIIQFINPIAFYQDRLKVPFDLSTRFGLRKGVGYLLLGLILTSLLFTPLGQEIGGMKVNLNLGIKFQPSEITKYLIVIFMSAYFCRNAEKIILYSEPGRNNLLGHKYWSMLWMIVGFVLLMGIYVLLQDLGPAMVVAFTFIIQYSIIKSKVDISALNDGYDEKGALAIKHFLTCDIAMLIYGILTFLIFLFVGDKLNFKLLAGVLWFVVWIYWGYSKRKQIVESPILFNLVIFAFVFGSNLKQIPHSTFEKIGERLEARSSMSTNTWGVLGLDGAEQNPAENSQVVDGLWGLASGGLNGQGLSRGECSLIPAFNTDMILESIGTQLGFWGILFVMLLYCVLLRRTVVVGFSSYHPFTFYLCLGIAIATGVQLLIIALGSIGVIPLTGVAVPLLSYGKVSMILNLLAFGLVLSVSHYGYKINQDYSEVNKYNGPIVILTCSFMMLVLVVCGTFFKYQVVDRNEVLVRPLLVKTNNDSPIIKYNPRIQLLTQNMRMGDIYDRNGVLLATSDKKKLAHHSASEVCKLNIDTIKKQNRYYPFDKHLFFMVGDYNTKLFFNGSDRGYMAEARHLDSLRGYSNIKKDARGRNIKIDIKPVEISAGRFVQNKTKSEEVFNIAYRDYSDLLPYLKAGINSERLEDYNNGDESWWNLGKIKPNDIHLTVDAILQTRLQQGMEVHMKKNFSGSTWNKVRASVVVLDANKGDLLASAVYPLPNYETLIDAPNSYSDNKKGTDWKSYTDMDLGLSYATAPGSTAKVISAIAGFMKEGNSIAQQRYHVHSDEKIFPKEPIGNLDLQSALRYSSNCYFINLVNDKNLYNELAHIYGNIGIQMYGNKSYGLQHREPTDIWKKNVLKQEENCISAYNKYMEKRKSSKQKMNNKSGKPDAWSWAWGQNDIYATPVSMARAISIVANNGKMPVTRFLKEIESINIDVLESSNCNIMKEYLRFTAKHHDNFDVLSSRLGGKTGTPERVWINTKGRETISNDGWYICFIEKANIDNEHKNSGCLAVAVRIERTGSAMSGKAVSLTKDIVIKTLQDLNYI